MCAEKTNKRGRKRNQKNTTLKVMSVAKKKAQTGFKLQRAEERTPIATLFVNGPFS